MEHSEMNLKRFIIFPTLLHFVFTVCIHNKAHDKALTSRQSSHLMQGNINLASLGLPYDHFWGDLIHLLHTLMK